MTDVSSALLGSIREIVGKFSTMQMIAIGVVALFAVLLGVLIGGLAYYRAGVKRGKRKGLKDAVSIALNKAKEKSAADIEAARAEEREKAAAAVKEKEEALAAAEKERGENARAIAEKDAALKSLEEANKALSDREKALAEAQAALEAVRKELEQAKKETETARSDAKKASTESKQAKEDAERRLKEAEELREERDRSNALVAAIPQRRTDITLLEKKEILAFAGDLEEYLPASIYERGGGELPDSCRVGICTFLLVYERKGMVKLVLRLNKETAAELERKYALFAPAVYPKGDDWYRWILSSEVTDLAVVTAAIRAAYEYTFLSNYDKDTKEINVEYANRDENAINEAIVKYKDLPDRDFFVASDAAEGVAYRLYGKKEMTDFAKSLSPAFPVNVSVSDGELSPNTFKVGGKTFLMAYEKDGVAKMIFRASDEEFSRLKEKHPTAEISSFPKAKGYHWYVVYIDQTFFANADIEEIIKGACAYVYSLTES